MSPKTAGSEPSGNSVADTNDTTNKVDKPNFGKASMANTDSNQASIGTDYRQRCPARAAPDAGPAAAILLPRF